jgi:hypothetical protein
MPFHDVCVCFLFFISVNPPTYTYCTYPCYIKLSLSTYFVMVRHKVLMVLMFSFKSIWPFWLVLRRSRILVLLAHVARDSQQIIFPFLQFFSSSQPQSFFYSPFPVNDSSSTPPFFSGTIDPTTSRCSVPFSHQSCGPVWLPVLCARLLPRPASWPRWPRRCSRPDPRLWIAPGPCWRHIRVLPSAGERLPTATREYVNINLDILWHGRKHSRIRL